MSQSVFPTLYTQIGLRIMLPSMIITGTQAKRQHSLVLYHRIGQGGCVRSMVYPLDIYYTDGIALIHVQIIKSTCPR